MYKIFKYPAGYEKGKLYYFGLSGKVVRTGWVEDNQYKGYWVWVIVNTESKDFQKIFVDEKPAKDISNEFYSNWMLLGVVEEQTVQLYENAKIEGVCVNNGFINMAVTQMPTTLEERKIVGYKTGQVIPYPPSNLIYIGCAPLIIKDEICIYFFEVF